MSRKGGRHSASPRQAGQNGIGPAPRERVCQSCLLLWDDKLGTSKRLGGACHRCGRTVPEVWMVQHPAPIVRRIYEKRDAV